MSFYNFIYNLQKKSERTKQRILIALLVVSFFVLAGFWVWLFKNQVAQISSSPMSGAERVLGGEGKLLSPLASLAEGFKGFKQDLTDKITEYKTGWEASQNDKKERPVYELPIE
ncbi:MAG: hypothetical protein WAP55_00235 [Minisyncoccia bacterium]